MSRETFDQAIARIGREAVAASLEEITAQLLARFGEDPQPVDWWKPDPEDPFWMIEVRSGFDDAGAWVKNEHTGLTTRDPIKALRFPSRFAAECARKRLYPKDGQFEPTEHLWADLRTPEGDLP